jgi:hypothetical protein
LGEWHPSRISLHINLSNALRQSGSYARSKHFLLLAKKILNLHSHASIEIEMINWVDKLLIEIDELISSEL